MKTRNLSKKFKRWAWFNVLQFAALSIFYIPYQVLWIRLEFPEQFLRWFLTAALFGSLVNLVMQPVTTKIVHWLDRRYPKQ